jgi:hypothetical protein
MIVVVVVDVGHVVQTSLKTLSVAYWIRYRVMAPPKSVAGACHVSRSFVRSSRTAHATTSLQGHTTTRATMSKNHAKQQVHRQQWQEGEQHEREVRNPCAGKRHADCDTYMGTPGFARGTSVTNAGLVTRWAAVGAPAPTEFTARTRT